MAKTPSSGTSGSNSEGKSFKKAAAASRKATTRKRDTLISLRKSMDDITARLNQADNLTQQSVSSLQNAFSVLEKRVNNESSVNKAALTKRVDQLTQHLTGLIAQTRSGVAQDLRQAQNNPSLERLQKAINTAEARLAQAELTQASALTKVNRHIADLARAIDARLSQDLSARNQAFADVNNDFVSLEQRTDARIKEIEQSSAAAIIRIGEHVVSLSHDFKERTENNTQAISAKMSTIALKTQREFEDYRSQVERRIESLEENQRNLDSYMDRSLSSFTTRIDNLEYGLTAVAPPATAPMPPNSLAPAPAPIYDDPFSPDVEAAPLTAMHDQPLTLETTQISPQLKLVPEPSPVRPEPVRAPKPFMSAPPAAAAPLMPSAPTEFIPEAYIPNSPANMAAAQTPLIQDIVPVPPQSYTPPASPTSGPQLYVASDSLAISEETPNASDMAVADLIGDDDLPYEDPAYAEHVSGADMKRPGAFDLKRKAPSSTPKISKRNLGVGVMALMVATVGYFALRGFIDRDAQTSAESSESQSLFVEQIESGSAPIAHAQNDTAISSATAPAIGEYEDNRGVDVADGSITATTLEAAAESGDPVAEFQLGLSRLQAGQTKQAVQLIRASANKGQPAAQYRLAKLYEAGEGVTADAEMARQLTERAATNGNRIAMHDLALYYAEGRGGVETNIKTAASWFEKAAQRGVVDSQYNLGVLYESGQGLPKNLTEAYIWYSIAAAQGDQFARKHIDLLKQQLSAADLKRAENASRALPRLLSTKRQMAFLRMCLGRGQHHKKKRAPIS